MSNSGQVDELRRMSLADEDSRLPGALGKVGSPALFFEQISDSDGENPNVKC